MRICFDVFFSTSDGQNEKWSFFPDEEKISISGYQFKEYKKFNIGSLLYRISSSCELDIIE